MIAIPILLVIKIHIRLTRLLKDGAATADYNLEGQLCGSS